MLNRRKVEIPCRECGEIPETGYFISRIVRNDWVCPECCNVMSKKIREDKLKAIKGENDDESNDGM